MITHTQKHKYQAYSSATQTVAKTQQIIILYDGMIRLVQQAKEAIREKRIEDRYNLLMKASNIVHGLQGCLDFENGKEIASMLYNFYSSVESRIFSIHRTNNMATCDEVIADLKQMRDAWVVVDEADAKSAVASNPVSPDASQAPSQPGTPATDITLSA